MTTNHPANGPVSLDRLHQISEILSKAAAQSDGGNLGYAMADAVKVIAGVMNAEPVAWLRETAITDICEGAWTPIIQMESQRMGVNLSESWGVNYIPLYTNPPAPVVPDEKRDDDGSVTSDFDHGWNACRDAMIHVGNFREISETSTNSAERCWCRTCQPVTMNDMRFVVCPDCGNKRCPHANDHRHACTGSNEPGQEGSAYPAAPQQEVKNV